MAYYMDGRHVGKFIGDLVVTRNVDGFVGKKTIKNVVRVLTMGTQIKLMHEGVVVSEESSFCDHYGFGTSLSIVEEKAANWIERLKITKESSLHVCVFMGLNMYYYILSDYCHSGVYHAINGVEGRDKSDRKSKEMLIWDSHTGWVYPKDKLDSYIKKKKDKESLKQEDLVKLIRG